MGIKQEQRRTLGYSPKWAEGKEMSESEFACRLKESLLSKGDVFIDNPALSDYCLLVAYYRGSIEKGGSHTHHVIPKFAYKVKITKSKHVSCFCDPDNFVVELPPFAHTIAHCLLSMASGRSSVGMAKKAARLLACSIGDSEFGKAVAWCKGKASGQAAKDILLRLRASSCVTAVKERRLFVVHKGRNAAFVDFEEVEGMLGAGWHIGYPSGKVRGFSRFPLRKDGVWCDVSYADAAVYIGKGWEYGRLKGDKKISPPGFVKLKGPGGEEMFVECSPRFLEEYKGWTLAD